MNPRSHRARLALVSISASLPWLVCGAAPRLAAQDAPREAAAKPAIGDVVPDCGFVDTWCLRRSLSDFGERKAFVLFFSNTDCPLVQRYLPRLEALWRKYRDRGVQFLSVNVGPGDSVVEMATQQVEQGLSFPFVKDFDGETVAATGVDRTAAVVVLDGERRLRYRGRVDRQFRFSGVSPVAGRQDLAEAIEDVLAGREVRVPETRVEGCRITPPRAPDPHSGVTYAKEIARIVQRHCQDCHRPGGQAPFSLLDYDDVADRAEMVAEVVLQQRMPPWYASPAHGEFRNARGLDEAERRAILDWVAADCPQGDPADLPPPREFPQREWRIDEPDLVLKVPAPVRIPADGYVPYKYLILPYRFSEDTWVEQIEIRPSNPRVLHHANLGYIDAGLRFRQKNFITGLVPGGDPMRLDPGTAVLVPKGAVLGLQCHYVTVGKPQRDRIEVGLRFPRRPVAKRLRVLIAQDHSFAIPPGATFHPVRDERILPVDAIGLGLFSHMHLRGRDMTFRAHYPDGRTETLLMIPNYNFDWQASYRWELGTRRFPKGTRIEVVAHYDNSSWNPFNPDPEATVRFGPQTHHEMMYGFLFYVDANENLGVKVDPRSGRARP